MIIILNLIFFELIIILDINLKLEALYIIYNVKNNRNINET